MIEQTTADAADHLCFGSAEGRAGRTVGSAAAAERQRSAGVFRPRPPLRALPTAGRGRRSLRRALPCSISSGVCARACAAGDDDRPPFTRPGGPPRAGAARRAVRPPPSTHHARSDRSSHRPVSRDQSFVNVPRYHPPAVLCRAPSGGVSWGRSQPGTQLMSWVSNRWARRLRSSRDADVTQMIV